MKIVAAVGASVADRPGAGDGRGLVMSAPFQYNPFRYLYLPLILRQVCPQARANHVIPQASDGDWLARIRPTLPF